MTAIIIASNTMAYPFGAQTNQAVSRLVGLQTQMQRLGEAIQTASAGFDGTPGTQFEVGNVDPANIVANLFGVQAEVANPGKQGQAYSYAMARLYEEWNKFWAAAEPFIQQLDNGQVSL